MHGGTYVDDSSSRQDQDRTACEKPPLEYSYTYTKFLVSYLVYHVIPGTWFLKHKAWVSRRANTKAQVGIRYKGGGNTVTLAVRKSHLQNLRTTLFYQCTTPPSTSRLVTFDDVPSRNRQTHVCQVPGISDQGTRFSPHDRAICTDTWSYR